jgi:mRNA interferase MazF
VAPRRGDVFWVTFAEPVGRRPVLIVQNDAGNRNSPSTIVVHVSAKPRRDYPFLVELETRELGTRSWVHCETVNTIPCNLLEEQLGTLAPATMLRVDEALRHSLGLG